MKTLRLERLLAILFWIILALLPLLLLAIDEPFYITLVTRLMIFALAASSLNLVLGYGGMVSFGHAAFFGIAGYTIGILANYFDVLSAWIAWPLAMGVAALLGVIIGAISLRTSGVYFIMITLALAQMLYYLFTSLRIVGGQDGMTVPRSTIAPFIVLDNNVTLYYVTLALLGLSLFVLYRAINARFGHVLQTVKENETRMAAIGYPTFRYKLVGFTIGAAFAGLAGVLNTNLNTFISPNSLSWLLSGSIMMMVILGGVSRFWGGVIGAFVFLLLETLLEGYFEYWQLALGLSLLLIVMLAPQGLAGLFARLTRGKVEDRDAPAEAPIEGAA